MTKFNYIKIVFVLTFFLNPLFSSAQTIADRVTISISPVSPAPNQTVSASVKSLEFNIDLAYISWSVNDKVVKKGQGEKNFVFQAPAAGKTAVLSVTVTPEGDPPITSSLDISPGGTIDLIWEAVDGYTPPFYRGKTLPIKQSTIRVSAVPNIKSASGVQQKPGSFTYTWKKDGKNVPAQSGFGRSSLSFVNQILESGNRIEVVASDGAQSVSGSIDMPFFVPEILFYEYDTNLSAPRHQAALGATRNVKQPRMTIVAEPYFLANNWFSNDGVVLGWKINGSSAKPGFKNSLGIVTSTTGSFDVEVKYDETGKLFRSFSNKTRINVE